MHTLCMIDAAQFDTRCPICRFRPEGLRERARREEDSTNDEIVEQLRQLHDVYVRESRAYARRKTRLFQRRPSLRELRDKLVLARRAQREFDQRLNSMWARVRNEAWATHSGLNDLKQQRRNALRRLRRAEDSLQSRLDQELGPHPSIVVHMMEHTPQD